MGAIVNTVSSAASNSALGDGAIVAADGASVLVRTAHATFGVYKPGRSSIVVVSEAAAATGTTVKLGTAGNYVLSGQDFKGGGIFDQRAATLPGTKGAAIGTTAVLFGMA